MQTPKKIIIGWSEKVDFPEWGIFGLRAKVDTGAKTSALHVEDIKKLSHERLQFSVILDPPNSYARQVVARLVRKAKVRSSTGTYTNRYVVKTTVTIGPVEKQVEISLVSREQMSFRMLLGRQALSRHFLVDASKQYLLR